MTHPTYVQHHRLKVYQVVTRDDRFLVVCEDYTKIAEVPANWAKDRASVQEIECLGPAWLVESTDE